MAVIHAQLPALVLIICGVPKIPFQPGFKVGPFTWVLIGLLLGLRGVSLSLLLRRLIMLIGAGLIVMPPGLRVDENLVGFIDSQHGLVRSTTVRM